MEKMCDLRKFFVTSFLVTSITQKHFLEVNGENVKIWKPNSNIFNVNNRETLGDNCDTVQFPETNFNDIIIDKLTSSEFLLPISGNLVLLDGGYLEIQTKKSKNSKKLDCFKLKRTKQNHFLDPNNWESDVSKSVAVPDLEKIPCVYDKIRFPNGIYSAVNTDGLNYLHTVSSIEFGNETFDRISFAAFKSTDLGSSVFSGSSQVQLDISERKCYDPASGCKCNRDTSIYCPPKTDSADGNERKVDVECLNSIKPTGFCNEICGAFLTFQALPNFSMTRLKDELKSYTDVQTHASQVGDDHLIQIVFAEETYSGESIVAAEKFMKKFQKESAEYGVVRISKLHVSGSETNGNSTWGVVFASFFFVLVLFGTIFYVTYGDRTYLTRFRLANFMTSSSTVQQLSSTYRARFSAREDESGLILDQNNHSPSGSAMDLHQSFDNPLYGQVSTGPDINAEDGVVKEKLGEEMKQYESSPLYDLSEIKEEIGAKFEELPDIKKLIDVEIPSKEESQEIEGEE